MRDQFKAAFGAARAMRNDAVAGQDTACEFAVRYLWQEAERWDRAVNQAVLRIVMEGVKRYTSVVPKGWESVTA